MKKQHTDDLDTPKAVTRMMLGTLFSTTVRVFLPVSVLFVIGLIVDLNAPTRPWGMAIGASLGIIIAIMLVAFQLKDIRKASGVIVSDGGKK